LFLLLGNFQVNAVLLFFTFAVLPSYSSLSLSLSISILAPYSFNLKHFMLATHFVITANGFMTFKSFFLGV